MQSKNSTEKEDQAARYNFFVSKTSGGFCLEKWNEEKKITIYIEPNRTEIYKIHFNVIADGTTIKEALDWLYNNDNVEII